LGNQGVFVSGNCKGTTLVLPNLVFRSISAPIYPVCEREERQPDFVVAAFCLDPQPPRITEAERLVAQRVGQGVFCEAP
jgi:hypothetical protein